MRTVAFGKLGDPEFDPKYPVAYPVEGRVGIMGEMPVRRRWPCWRSGGCGRSAAASAAVS